MDKNELFTLYYIAGFLCKKFGIPSEEITDESNIESSEFSILASKDRLSYPPTYLFNFVQCCYYMFQELKPSCSTSFIKICKFFFESNIIDAQEDILIKPLCTCLVNTFFAGYVRKLTDQNHAVFESALDQRKRRKLQLSSVNH